MLFEVGETVVYPHHGAATIIEVKDRIIGDFRSAMAELRCIGSDRLLRLGVSMSQLHVMSMLERHGEISAARQFSGRAVNDDWQCPFRDPRA